MENNISLEETLGRLSKWKSEGKRIAFAFVQEDLSIAVTFSPSEIVHATKGSLLLKDSQRGFFFFAISENPRCSFSDEPLGNLAVLGSGICAKNYLSIKTSQFTLLLAETGLVTAWNPSSIS